DEPDTRQSRRAGLRRLGRQRRLVDAQPRGARDAKLPPGPQTLSRNHPPVPQAFHVIPSPPKVFFKKLEPLGQLSKPEYDENTVRYGTSRIDQFTWKQVLDMFSCTEGGRCSSQCPATATGKPLAPRQLLLDLRDYLYKHQDEVIAKRVGVHTNGTGGTELPEVGENIVGPVIEDEVLWSCNMC